MAPGWKGRSSISAPDGSLTTVSVKTAPKFEHGAAQALFDAQIPAAGLIDGFFHYDVAADGKRFLVNSNAIDRAVSVTTPHHCDRQLARGFEAVKMAVK